MTLRKNGQWLRFPCECVSTHRGYTDPWAAIAQNKLLNNGTKERLLNVVARQPKTIAGIAKELGLSQPTVHAHVSDMLDSELLRVSPDWEKKHPSENYYQPNFPVIKAGDRAAFDAICDELATGLAELFQARQSELEVAIGQTTLPEEGWTYHDVAHYLFATVQRRARTLLEQRDALPPREKHADGAEWVFWAEEPFAPQKTLRR